ncbi:beta-lactamase family protein [bacterium]|nr:beta-lactamase family protein [bacterium]
MKSSFHTFVVFYCLSSFWQVFAKSFPNSDSPKHLSLSQNTSFKKLDDYLFSKQQKFQTDSFLIIHKEQLIFEKYAHGYKKGQKHRIWSISKSITALLIAIAQEQEILNLDHLVSQYYQEIQKPYHNQLTLRNLMHMSSGLNWSEGYESNPLNSDVIKMLYIDSHLDMATFTANRNFKYAPGEVFHYSSGESNLIMGILKKAIHNQEVYNNYPWKELFDPLGIDTVTWQQDASGTFVGSSYIFMSPDDLAKIGSLVLHQGQWNKKQIVNKAFIQYMSGLAPAFSKMAQNGELRNDSYGAQWWLNQKIGSQKVKYPSAPEDMILGLGHHGQLLIIIPSLDLVAVRAASDKEGRIDKDTLFSHMLGALQ